MFAPILETGLYGYCALRPDGIRVELVRIYQGDWDVFLTRKGQVVACGYPQPKRQLSFQRARSRAVALTHAPLI